MKFKLTLALCFLTLGFAYGQYDWTKGELILKNGKRLQGEIQIPMVSKGV